MLTPLNEIVIKKYLQEDIFLNIVESISSTNDYFKGKPRLDEFEFCFAEHQTQGRGRLGRSWHSPAGQNLMLSCRWSLPENLKTKSLQGLSSCISLSLLSALQYLNIPDLKCKWPNDLFYQDKKLAGILIELYSLQGQITEAIIGIGMNVNMPEDTPSALSIEKPWTSLQHILGKSQERNKLAAQVIQHLTTYLTRFAEKGWTDFIAEWNQYDYLTGKEVSMVIDNKNVNGTARGVDLSGSLLIETPHEGIITCSSGEIKILPG